MWVKILHPDDRVRALAENVRHNETGEPFPLEYRLLHEDGPRGLGPRRGARSSATSAGNPRYSHGVMLDVTDAQARDDAVAFRPTTTSSPGSRRARCSRSSLDLSIARARRHEGAVAVLCVDLDDFRLVNDSLGHSRRRRDAPARSPTALREATRETDLVARRGGDQFLLLLARSRPRRVPARRREIARRGRRPADQRLARVAVRASTGNEVYVSAGIGISLFPNDARGRRRDPAQRRVRDVRGEEGPAQANYVLSNGGALRLGGQAAVRDASAQGGRGPALDAALPAGDRPRDGRDDRRRGADPVDRARRHDGAAAASSSRSPRSWA